MNLKRLYFSVYDLAGNRDASQANRLLEQSQYWSRNRIQDHQLKKLKDLFEHAAKNIPYYQKIIKKAPEPTWNFQDMMAYLQDIPILKKSDVQEFFEELIDPGVDRKKLVYQRSGGTTGRPTQFYHDRIKLDYTRVALQRNFDWAGYTMRKKCLKLASGQYEVTINKGMKGKLKNLLFNRFFFEGAFLTNERWADEVVQIIRQKKIKVLWGYASILYMLAKELGNGKDLGIETMISSSETLLPSQRQKIEETFGCKVFDDYGSREFMVAAECEAHSGMHINEEIILLEILDESGSICQNGTNGNLIITDLYNRSFPFIRFEIGDRGAFFEEEEPCACGRTLKRLKQFDGRSSETIKVGDSVVSQSIFPDYFKTVKNIEAYQIVKSKDLLTINLILFDKEDHHILGEVEEHLQKRFQQKIRVKVQQVSSLIQEPNGKVLVVKKMD